MLILKKLMDNRYVQLIGMLLLGLILGALFYPSKTIREEEQLKYQKQVELLKTEHSKEVAEINVKATKEIATAQQINEELKASYNKTMQENTQLKRKVKKRTIKITKPDGTIIERVLAEQESESISEVKQEIKQEYEHKLAEVTNQVIKENKERTEKLMSEHQSAIHKKDLEIKELQKKKTVEINKRSTSISGGYMTDKQYYGSFDRDIVGPLFLDITGTTDGKEKKAVGAGFGIRW